MKNAIKVICFVLAVILIGIGAFYFAFYWQKGEFEITEGVNKNTAIITGYIGEAKDVNIPDRIRGKKVVSIGDSAFSETDITSVTLSKNVTSIDEYAFSECKNLKKIDLKNVKSIGDSCFYNCVSLENVELPSTLEKIGSMPFACDEKLTVTIKDNTNFVIEDDILYTADKKTLITVLPQAEIKEYICPAELENITEFAFMNQKNLSKFVYNDKIQTINAGTFINCSSLKELNIPSNITSIKGLIINGSGITSLTVPETVTKIEREAFKTNDGEAVLKLKANSVAENFAKQYKLKYEVIK